MKLESFTKEELEKTKGSYWRNYFTTVGISFGTGALSYSFIQDLDIKTVAITSSSLLLTYAYSRFHQGITKINKLEKNLEDNYSSSSSEDFVST